MRHWRPRAGRCEAPPTGCFASGENEKKPAGKCTFLTGFFLHFHCARGLSFRFPKFVRKEEGGKSLLLRRMGAGPMALLPGYGGRIGPCFVVPHATCGKTNGKADFCIAGWVQGQCPWYGGRGAPCSVIPQAVLFSCLNPFQPGFFIHAQGTFFAVADDRGFHVLGVEQQFLGDVGRIVCMADGQG